MRLCSRFTKSKLGGGLIVPVPDTPGKFHPPFRHFTGGEIKPALQIIHPRRRLGAHRRAGLLQKGRFRQHPGVGIGALDLLQRRLQQRTGFPRQGGRRTHQGNQMIRGAGGELASAVPAQSHQSAFQQARLRIAAAQRPLAQLADIQARRNKDFSAVGSRKNPPAPRFVAKPADSFIAEGIEQWLARTQEGNGRGVTARRTVAPHGNVRRQPAAPVTCQRLNPVRAGRPVQPGALIQVALNLKSQPGQRLFGKVLHIGRQQLVEPLDFNLAVELSQPFGDVAKGRRLFPLFLDRRPQPLRRKHGFQLLLRRVGRGFKQCLAQQVADGNFLKLLADHVENFVGAKFAPRFVQFRQQRRQHVAFAGLVGDEVEDAHFVMALAETMQPAHTLFQPRRIPRHVKIHHQPCKLQIDAFTRRIRRQHDAGARRVRVRKILPAAFSRRHEENPLTFPFLYVHAAVDCRDLPGITERFKPMLQMFERVAMLRENQQPFVLKFRRVHQFAQLQKFVSHCAPRMSSPCLMISSR